MSLNDAFKKSNCYAPIAIFKKSPCETARDLIAYFCRHVTDETITGVLHIERGGLVRDNISKLQDNRLYVVRDNTKTLSFLLDKYLEDVRELYLELKDRQHEFGIGIEHSPEGSKLSHYLRI